MDEAPDRLIVMFDPKGPVEIIDLTASFAALARFYERHYRLHGEHAPKLYITRLETGSIIAEVAPYAWFLGQAFSAMGTTVSIADFTQRLAKGIKIFADPSGPTASYHSLSREDAADLREFTRPLAGKQGATLGIKHARFHQRDGARETVVEYSFDEAEINRATINLNAALESFPSEFQITQEQRVGVRKSSRGCSNI